MKTKYIFYSNFQYNNTKKNEDDKKLFIEDSVNVNNNNGYIESELSINEILFELYDSETAESIKFKNRDILSSVTKIIPYQYFDDINQNFQIRLFCLIDGNIFYELNNETLIFENRYTFISTPKETLSDGILYIFNSNKCAIIEQNNVISIENIPDIETFSFDENYLYFTTQNNSTKLYITEKCSLKNISCNTTQYEYIQINIEDGLIYKIVNIKDKIYIFTQYSIFRLNNDKTLTKQNILNMKIYKDSINQLDDSIVFYSTNGIYLFDGNDLKQLLVNSCNISESANFILFDQNLFILSKNSDNFLYKYSFTNNQFYKINLPNLTNIFLIKTYSCYKICTCQKCNNINIINTLYSNKVNNTSNQVVKFKTTFWGSNKLKQIKSLIIKSTGDFTLKISSDVTNSVISISNKSSNFNLNLNGSYFNFEISSDKYFKFESILLGYEEIGE